MITNDKIVENIKATMAAEGLFLQEKDVSLINQYLNNEITVEQGIDIIKKDVMSKMNNRNV
ncbi:MAG: antitoxin VbhA family protein [Clostridia bacterium]|nr:antitoxin VbhA family protein [Clostridia bacterium]